MCVEDKNALILKSTPDGVLWYRVTNLLEILTRKGIPSFRFPWLSTQVEFTKF